MASSRKLTNGDEMSPRNSLKHPLNSWWKLWRANASSAKSWGKNLRALASFRFVEDFWDTFSEMTPASKLPEGTNYFVFKNDILPMWEDVQNKYGGRWVIQILREDRATVLDDLWEKVILMLVGNIFYYDLEVCGAVVHIRPTGDKISIWNKDADDKETIITIGTILKECLYVDTDVLLEYLPHPARKNKRSKPKKKNVQKNKDLIRSRGTTYNRKG